MGAMRELKVKKVSASKFRDDLRECLEATKQTTILLIQNRRLDAKYVVDQGFFDQLIKERESFVATLEILSDPKLTQRLLDLKETGFDKAKLYTMDEVFG